MKNNIWTKEQADYLIPRVLARDKRKCRHCGSRLNLTIHHILPRESGGPDEERNLITLCTICHDKAELGELVWTEYGFSAKEIERRRSVNHGKKIDMFMLRDGVITYIGSRYE